MVRFGTFKGVFVPSILTILGVIMYLRMGWVVGQVGFAGSVVIITLASAITFLTALSISATATNMKVGGGGAYFMISRSFGIEAGAAIGLPLYLAQAVGISFYIAGFSESIHQLVPIVSPQIIGTISLLGLAFLTYVSSDLALKTQLGILALIVLSLVSLFAGKIPAEGLTAQTGALTDHASFWVVFAVFFPAVTGIEAGISMSGDLKNPSRSLPWGTIAAVVVGYLIYLTIAWHLSNGIPDDVLISNPLIMMDIAWSREAILIGICGATLSSALGALLGAPRTLRALAQDRVLPQWLSPKMCEITSFAVALIGVWLGDLNMIAPILAMFFLTSYGVLNLAAGIESLIANPSWRPSFRTPWWLSFTGAFGCIAAMFMIDAGATFIAIILSTLIYLGMSKRKMGSRWSDITYGMMMSLSRYAIYKLSRLKVDARSWRPNLLVFSGTAQDRLYLIELADAITHGQGFLTVATILTSEQKIELGRIESMEKSVRKLLDRKNIPALVEISTAKDVQTGMENLVSNYGIGPLTPNTIVIGEAESQENYAAFTQLIRHIANMRRNVLVIRESHRELSRFSRFFRSPKKKIDVWWYRKNKNVSLMLALSHMLQTSTEWRGAELNLKTIVPEGADQARELEHLNKFISDSRIEATAHVYLSSNEPFQTIKKESGNANLVFLGLAAPEEFSESEYVEYYKSLLEKTKDFPLLIFTLASEDMNFKEIFN